MASELKVDKFTGVTTAGSILVTGEGNSTTTSLQQGLAKVWIAYALNTGSPVVTDSFNVSGTTDNAAGDTTYAFSSNMATTKGYTVSGKMSPDGDTTTFVYSPQPLADDHVLTSSLRITTNYAGASAANSGDYPYNSNNVHGDLA
jgi:hypothetical protein